MRHLIPNFFISTHPLGWQCSRAFPTSGMVAITDAIPSAITAEFEAHCCRPRSLKYQPRSEDSAD
jgi:hypothetical protein